MDDMRHQRDLMVDMQLFGRGIRDPFVLDAMREVPREKFVAESLSAYAYQDSPLPIGEGQTISQPLVVAEMAEAAFVRPGNHVLEVGAGCGYAAAVLGRIAARVIAIERRQRLGEEARQRMAELGYQNVEIRIGDGTAGAPEDAPFDSILVSAGGPRVPPALKAQLKIGGRIVIPVGEPGRQKLMKITRLSKDDYEEIDMGAVSFVPLIGEQGWPDEGRPQS